MRATGSRAVRIGTPSRPHSSNDAGEITLRHSGSGRCTGRGRNSGTCSWKYLPLVGDRAALPQALDHLDRLLHARAAVVAAQPVTDEFVFVVDRALADPDIDPAPAEIVEQRQSHRELDRMVKRQLHDGEADADALGAHRDRGGEQQRVVVDALAGKIMLGQPDIVEAEPLGGADLRDLLVDARRILFRRRRQRQGEPPETHRCLRETREPARLPTIGQAWGSALEYGYSRPGCARKRWNWQAPPRSDLG